MVWQARMANGQLAVPCAYYRGGTSKGPAFVADDLPSDDKTLARFLLAALDSAHYRQVDGIGGPETLSNKVVIVSKSKRADADVDYRFFQLVPGEPLVDPDGTCGNMLSVVGPFAIERGLVFASGSITDVKIFAVNSNETMTSTVQTPGGIVSYEGSTGISGVDHGAAPITLTYHTPFGCDTGKLLPTGNAVDVINDIPLSIVDSGVLSMIFRASAFGMSGLESKVELDNNKELAHRIERLRQSVGTLLSIENPAQNSIPKPIMVSDPGANGSITSRDLATRSFLHSHCHAAHSGSGAIALATAAVIPGTIPYEIAKPGSVSPVSIVIEHPAGAMEVTVNLQCDDADPRPQSLSLVRTCRKLFDGHIHVRCSFDEQA